MSPLALQGRRQSVGDLARAAPSPLDDYVAKEKAFLAASTSTKRPWLAGSLDHSKCIDANRGETLLNIVTSLVYNVAAFHIPKRCAPPSNTHQILVRESPWDGGTLMVAWCTNQVEECKLIRASSALGKPQRVRRSGLVPQEPP
jgi:hypothetical protein